MPRSKGKGGKGRKRGKNYQQEAKELVFKEDGQEYAQVTRMLGNGRIEAYCFDGKTRQCHIRGQMQRRVWINMNDVILVSLREYEDAKADVIKKYNSDEIIQLKKYKEVPERLQTDEADDKKDVGIRFGVGDAESDDGEDDLWSGEESEGDSDEESYEDEVPPQNRVYTLDDL
ncbi:Eukaryotic translation initiation factor 4C [Entamoeba marina]